MYVKISEANQYACPLTFINKEKPQRCLGDKCMFFKKLTSNNGVGGQGTLTHGCCGIASPNNKSWELIVSLENRKKSQNDGYVPL